MNILVVGSGGREHAIAWKLSQSPRTSRLYIAPGNAGTALIGDNIPIEVDNVTALVNFSLENLIDLIVVGPEIPLAAGIIDTCQENGIRAFGPKKNAAQLESSKVFAKNFMIRHNIPTAHYQSFRNFDDAQKYIKEINHPIVVKASGLAAGKGVVIPETKEEAIQAAYSMLIQHDFGFAGNELIIEEKLSGEEVSVLAFTDGKTIQIMPPAQDHKRLLDGDTGPNTGGMGAYAPAPVCGQELLRIIKKTILEPTIKGMDQEGKPYTGVLYAGLMITPDGPRLLEYNCRFGDPETQAILPLLESDLVDIMMACIDANLITIPIRWNNDSSLSVVLASDGYPGKYQKGYVISDHNPPSNQLFVFHAGTRIENRQVVTAGGRVLNVTGLGRTIADASDKAYQAVGRIDYKGKIYRRDIGLKALHSANSGQSIVSSYKNSGVDIDAGNYAVLLMRDAVQSTYNPAVLSRIGSFGGLFDASKLKAMQNPILVASTDGVGTKVRLAAHENSYESIGEDIVNHCIGDILVQGAFPLFFLDYFASSKLDPQVVARVVNGISKACREADCVLLGGETAEMPGVYAHGEFDLAGTIIGVVERDSILPKPNIKPGDLVIGLKSSGPHTNGYSLIREIIDLPMLNERIPGETQTISDALLAPHRSYLPILRKCLTQSPWLIKGLAHITGGGFIENIPRIIPEGVGVCIHTDGWPVPQVFQIIQQKGEIAKEEMYRVFNMGIGMIAVVSRGDFHSLQSLIEEEIWIIGELREGNKEVNLL